MLVGIVWACMLIFVWLRGKITVGEIQQVVRCGFYFPATWLKSVFVNGLNYIGLLIGSMTVILKDTFCLMCSLKTFLTVNVKSHLVKCRWVDYYYFINASFKSMFVWLRLQRVAWWLRYCFWGNDNFYWFTYWSFVKCNFVINYKDLLPFFNAFMLSNALTLMLVL